MKKKMQKCAALIVAAGNGSRMNSGTDKNGVPINKMFICILGVPVIAHTLMAFEQCSFIDEIVVATRAVDIPSVKKICDDFNIRKLKTICTGGETRQESVIKGLGEISGDMSLVAIHDGARCLITPSQIGAVCMAANEYGAAAPAVACTDSLVKTDESGKIICPVDRKNMFCIQTPQIFELESILSAHKSARQNGITATDDTAVAAAAGISTVTVQIGKNNIKITTPDDIELAEAILSGRE